MVGWTILDSPVAHLTARGTYALGLRLHSEIQVTVGALGRWSFPLGVYVYVGSAWGPGGIAARLGRHLRGSGKRHWHIDYVRAYAQPVAVWCAEGLRDECVWAQHLQSMPTARIIVPRFGASDCGCAAHLIYLGSFSPASLSLPGAHGPLLLE